MRLLFALAFLSAVVAAAPTWAASCLPRSVAPGQFPDPLTGGDAGIVTTGFLDLRGPQGLYRVAHGVDLSDNNRPNYDQLKFCGTEFAIIKLYPTRIEFNQAQIQELKRQNITILPYYYLNMPGRYKYFPERFNADDTLPKDIADAEAVGQADAASFLQSYHRLFGANHEVTVSGLKGDLIALDVEEALDSSSPAAIRARGGFPPLGARDITPDEYNRYGQTYSAMVASWVKAVQSGLPGVTILFYTYPSMYITYLLPARMSDYIVFHGLPVWLAEPTKHGGDLTDASPAVLKGARQLCFSSSGGNKCVVHQYTARGVFGQLQPSSKRPTMHLDLDRFFWVDQLADGVNRQYVRKVDYLTTSPSVLAPPAPPPTAGPPAGTDSTPVQPVGAQATAQPPPAPAAGPQTGADSTAAQPVGPHASAQPAPSP